MSRSLVRAACAVASLVVAPAFADQSLSVSLIPTLSLRLQFGGAAHRNEESLHMTALVDVRSQLLRHGLDMTGGERPTAQPVDTTALSFGEPLVKVLQLDASPRGFEFARVLGHDMINPRTQLNEAEQAESEGGHSWLWWTAGVLVVGTVVALSADGDDQGSDPREKEGCSVATGESAVPPDFSAAQGCGTPAG